MEKESTPVDDPENRKTGPFWKHWPLHLRWVVGVAVVIGIGWLLARAWRRGQTGSALATVSVGAAAALAATQPARHPRPNRDDLGHALREAAAERVLWTPTELFERLRGQGLAVTSPQRLARDLADFGLASAVRTVDGRPERRWYDLTTFRKA